MGLNLSQNMTPQSIIRLEKYPSLLHCHLLHQNLISFFIQELNDIQPFGKVAG